MRFASAISTQADDALALSEVLEAVRSTLDDDVDFFVFFAAAHSPEAMARLARGFTEAFPNAHSLGVTAESVIGAGREIERQPGLSILAGSLPDVRIQPFAVPPRTLVGYELASELPGTTAEDQPVFLAVAEPYSCDVRAVLDLVNRDWPGCPLIGGLASGAQYGGGNRLYLDGEEHLEGMIGLALSGNVEVVSVLSQGARPIGRHFVITEGEGNIIRKLGGRPALEQLEGMIAELEEADVALARSGLLIGRAIDEYKSNFGTGDFLIQGLLGISRDESAIAVSATIKVGTTVQFHVRDGESADEELRNLLGLLEGPSFAGALLFSCNGRGTRMWPEPNHDVSVLDAHAGAIPSAGFFCAGELGPVGGQNFVHGLTASIALLRPRNA